MYEHQAGAKVSAMKPVMEHEEKNERWGTRVDMSKNVRKATNIGYTYMYKSETGRKIEGIM